MEKSNITYKVEGFINQVNLSFLNKFKVKDLNFAFNIVKNKYLFKEINTIFNGINIKSPQIQIKEKKNLYLVDNIKVFTDLKVKTKD